MQTGTTSHGDTSGGLDGPKFDAGIPDAGTPDGDCKANYIYVLADIDPHIPFDGLEGDPWVFRFVVETLTFEKVAPISETCHFLGFPGPGRSFGVDRSANLYVSGSGAMLHIDLLAENPVCEYLLDPVPEFGYASLSYVLGDDGNETLYLSNYDFGLGYGWLDVGVSPPSYTKLGDKFHEAYESAPMAGTGDGRLYAAEPNPGGGVVPLVQLEPTTGSVLATVGEVDAVASPYLAFYGGDLFLFERNIEQDPEELAPTVRVRRFDLDDDNGDGEHEVDVLLDFGDVETPFLILGAASPTCLPLTPEG